MQYYTLGHQDNANNFVNCLWMSYNIGHLYHEGTYILQFLDIPGDNIEITSVNRPEGRAFDWLYEPMCIIKDQIRSLNLQETEELYFYKHCLYGGGAVRIESWQNGGIPPHDEIKRAQLEGISRRYDISVNHVLVSA